MNLESKNGLYFDLDCLYDTRLATLKLIDEQVMQLALERGYHKRFQDSFPFVDKKTFRRLYSRRDSEYLDNSNLTKLPIIIGNFLTDAAKRVVGTPYTDTIHIFINTWPYKLSPLQVAKYIMPVRILNNGISNITVIRKSPAELTLPYCSEHFSLMVMYDYEDWLEAQTKNDGFKDHPIPDITLFVPELYFAEKEVTEEDIRQAMKTSVHPFRYIEKSAKMLIDLQMIDIDYYSAVIEKSEDKTSNQNSDVA